MFIRKIMRESGKNDMKNNKGKDMNGLDSPEKKKKEKQKQKTKNKKQKTKRGNQKKKWNENKNEKRIGYIN
jgi:hypothetical protein